MYVGCWTVVVPAYFWSDRPLDWLAAQCSGNYRSSVPSITSSGPCTRLEGRLQFDRHRDAADYMWDDELASVIFNSATIFNSGIGNLIQVNDHVCKTLLACRRASSAISAGYLWHCSGSGAVVCCVIRWMIYVNVYTDTVIFCKSHIILWLLCISLEPFEALKMRLMVLAVCGAPCTTQMRSPSHR